MSAEEVYKYNKYWRTAELLIVGVMVLVFGLSLSRKRYIVLFFEIGQNK